MTNANDKSLRLLLRGEKPSEGGLGMKWRHAISIAIFMLAVPMLVLAQSTSDGEGRVWGDYIVHQSIEFGGHIADSEGNQQMYLTFVNLGSGPRLLGQELSMQSATHESVLFDNLFMSSFGFGGDPEGLARLRVEKNKWYNFVGLYRRDKNFFDYDLFANPLNLNQGITTCVNPGNPVPCTNAFTPSALSWFTNSPHLQATTRNMGDFALTLLPESAVSFRLGYARNVSYGQVNTTLEAPLRSLLTEDSQWRSDRYQFGVDLKMLPRTTISGDVFFEHDKNDIGFLDGNLIYTLANAGQQQILFNGQPLAIDSGILLPPLSGSLPSCGTQTTPVQGPGVQTIFSGNLFLLTPGCVNGILLNTGQGGAFFRHGNVRTDIPTGQLSLQSNYFRKLDITASGTYSSASSDYLNFADFAHLNTTQPGAPTPPATVSTSNSNLFLIGGFPSTSRVSANADLGVTYHISKSLFVSDKFRWLNWREPGGFAQTQFGCFLPAGAAAATAVGTTGAFTSLLNPCNSTILSLINPASGLPIITTAGAVADGRGNYQQIISYGTIIGERSYFNTFKVNWQPSRRFSGYLGYRYGRRSFQDGNADITGILSEVTSNFVNDGTGSPPTVPRCNAGTPGCDTTTGVITNIGGVDSEQINIHTALLGVVVRPVDAWRINGDLELLYADNFFTNISPRHQQRARIYSTYKVRPWASINGGLHFIETRNDFAPSEQIDTGVSGNTCNTATNPLCLLFPTAGVVMTPYGHKDHWRYYTLGATLTKSKYAFDFGWTLLDQNINSATCMPISAGYSQASSPFFPFNVISPATATSPPAACNSSATARNLLLDYQETTNSGYTNISFHPVKRVTLNFGYEITSDSGATNWLRADNGAALQVVGDIFGNSPPLAGNPITPCPGASVAVGCVFPGPFPDQPLGPQAINWHKASAGVGFELAKGFEFKGLWSYYDYNSKDHPQSLVLLRVTTPRDFHANVGTLSLRYSF